MFAILSYIYVAVPYIAIQFIPGVKSFIIATILSMFIVIYLYRGLDSSDYSDSTVPSLIYGLPILSVMAGLIIKASTLYMKSRGVAFDIRVVTSLLGIFIIPCFVFILVVFR